MYELCSRLRAAEFGGRSGMPSLSTSRMELCPCVGCITFLNTLSVSWTSAEENQKKIRQICALNATDAELVPGYGLKNNQL